MSTLEIFRKFNIQLLNEIMDKDFGIIECGSIIDPKESIFNEPINPKLCLKKKEPTSYLELY
jgi:hypothetical protein